MPPIVRTKRRSSKPPGEWFCLMQRAVALSGGDITAAAAEVALGQAPTGKPTKIAPQLPLPKESLAFELTADFVQAEQSIEPHSTAAQGKPPVFKGTELHLISDVRELKKRQRGKGPKPSQNGQQELGLKLK